MSYPCIREKFTRERSAARKFTKEYFERFPKDQYQTELEGWRLLQSANIEFTMKRLREPTGGYYSAVRQFLGTAAHAARPSAER